MSATNYTCGVLNCGNGKCVHQVIDETCPVCGKELVLVTTSGVVFCSNQYYCDYDRDPLVLAST